VNEGTFQAQITKYLWWVVLGAEGAALLIYFLTRGIFMEFGSVMRVGVVIAWSLFCRLVFWKRPTWGAVAMLTVIIAAMPVFLIDGPFGNSFGGFAVSGLPTLFLTVLIGRYGVALAALAGISNVILLRGDAEEIGVGAMIFVTTAISGALAHHLFKRLEETNGRMKQISRTDPLTHLGNRRALEQDFPELQIQGTMLLSLWDVNGLKRINDRHGHAAGDKYLLDFTKSLKAASSPGDQLYRVGGDEFVGLHPNNNSFEMLHSRVLIAFDNVSGGHAQVTSSSDLDTALREADQGMYRDKKRAVTSSYVEP
jgi:GGDEF domain-containing protein